MRSADFPPIGLLSIATVLRDQEGHQVRILDTAENGMKNPEIVEAAREFKADLIGMTTFVVNESAVLSLVRDCKAALPGVPVILGGPHASSYPMELMEKEPVLDAIVMKEGEVTVVEYVKALENGGDLSGVLGLVYRNGAGEVATNNPRPVVKDMDSFPIPDRNFVDVHAYQPIPNMYQREPNTSMITSRGCPFSCTYCFEAGVLAQLYRRRSPEKVIEEIKYLIDEYGIREIAFWDDEFVLNNKWVRAFCDLMIAEKIDITWSCFGRVGSVTRDLLQSMSRAGCWSISFGIESGNQESLDFIKKECTVQEIRDAVRWTHEAGIETRCSFMLALPGETPEMGQRTIDFAIDLDVDYAQFFATNPLQGTPLYEDSLHLGTRAKDVKDYGFSRPFRAPFVPKGYNSEEQILSQVQGAHRQFYFRPKYVFKRLKRIRGMEDLQRYWRGMKMVLEV